MGDRIASVPCRAGYFSPGRVEEYAEPYYSTRPGANKPILLIVLVLVCINQTVVKTQPVVLVKLWRTQPVVLVKLWRTQPVNNE